MSSSSALIAIMHVCMNISARKVFLILFLSEEKCCVDSNLSGSCMLLVFAVFSSELCSCNN